MSQHDMIIDNAVGATVRTDINAALAALVSNNSGATEPATMYADMLWMDTTANVLKMRNPSNTGWIALSGGFASVTSSASPDIFGAAGVAINLNNSTPVTATSFATCLSEQVGTTRKVVPAQNWSVTASANLVVDGATSGTFVMPANAHLEVRAETTTKFILTTIQANISWTPSISALTLGGGAPTLTGILTKVGRKVSGIVQLTTAGGGNTTASTAGATYINNIPITVGGASSCVTVADGSTFVGTAGGYMPAGLTQCYLPTWSATTNAKTINFEFFV